MLNLGAFRPSILDGFKDKVTSKISPGLKFKIQSTLDRSQILHDAENYKSLTDMFFRVAGNMTSTPFLWYWKDDRFMPIPWSEAASKVLAVASGLRNMGLTKGDRAIILSDNRPDWCVADLAILSAGGVTVPSYTTNTATELAYLFSDSEAKFLIASNAKFTATAIKAMTAAGVKGTVVSMDATSVRQEFPDIAVESWDDLIKNGTETPSVSAGNARAANDLDDMACLIYTSGTTSAPKGAMLTHRNILTNCMAAFPLLRTINFAGPGKERFLSLLPLSHAYEHTLGQFLPIMMGAHIYYAPALDKVVHYIGASKPTLMLCVPRLYDVMKQRITQQLSISPPAIRRLFERTLALGRKKYEGVLSLREAAENKVLDWSVRRTMTRRFGGKLKAFVSGGAPLNIESGMFFYSLGVTLLQGYGQTECSPLIAVNDDPDRLRLETVGPIVCNLQCRIAPDGEILVRGPSVMKGYWKKPELNPFDKDGWLYTGDIGRIEEHGHLVITDRKKDMIISSGGDNISPAKVEALLTAEPEIAQAMVYGDRHTHLVAVIVPAEEFVADWAKASGAVPKLADFPGDAEFTDAVFKSVERANAKLPVVEQVKKIIVAGEPFGLENGLMTPSLKIKRGPIRDIYGHRLEALYLKGK